MPVNSSNSSPKKPQAQNHAQTVSDDLVTGDRQPVTFTYSLLSSDSSGLQPLGTGRASEDTLKNEEFWFIHLGIALSDQSSSFFSRSSACLITHSSEESEEIPGRGQLMFVVFIVLVKFR